MNKLLAHHTRSVSLALYIHIIAWILVFTFPLLMETRSDGIRWNEYIRHMAIPVLFFITFYVNYCLLVPQYLFKKQHSHYVFYNVVLILGMVAVIHLWYLPYIQECIRANEATLRVQTPDNHPPHWVFVIKDCVIFIFTAGLGAAIRMSAQWQKAETARQEAEQSRMEAELNNLRNQLNPHFLLNTLNNIYALIAFDSDKAQQAVLDLSKLLRHVLYENRNTYVPLCKEIDFIHNYIELMRIRLFKGVKVDIDIQVSQESQTPIAPLIFISLIENAFKHGISPTEPSFIHITIREHDAWILCEIKNSNHPKSHSDKSGSGIGLEQVKKRLELLYPGRYEWEKNISGDGRVYTSILNIRTK